MGSAGALRRLRVQWLGALVRSSVTSCVVQGVATGDRTADDALLAAWRRRVSMTAWWLQGAIGATAGHRGGLHGWELRRPARRTRGQRRATCWLRGSADHAVARLSFSMTVRPARRTAACCTAAATARGVHTIESFVWRCMHAMASCACNGYFRGYETALSRGASAVATSVHWR
jgi:hypothetical protein